MIDNFSLLLSHALVLVACWRLLWRRDLDHEGPEERPNILRNASPATTSRETGDA